ncbi:MAG TPA: MFS transporter [Anaerolineae bacterium]|nr:MFS transporter [Anaerolineae bacterium]HOR00461.1 MFS transporter [Anaerolineae bacterium]HPL28406.1 MFS transporter [Anaerolineae bacterium]
MNEPDSKTDHDPGAAAQAGVQRGPRGWIARFGVIWSGQALSLLGSQFVSFALIWYLTLTTQSATVLATASLVGLLPRVFLGPFVGALVDRWNRRYMMMAADACVALATLAIALLFALGVVQTWHIYLLLLARAIGGSFHYPAMLASTSLMVPKEHLTRVQGLNQALDGGLKIISAPLGALLLGVLPMQGILALDVITALLAIVSLIFVHIPQPPRPEEVAGRSNVAATWHDMAAGLRYIFSWTGLALAIMMATMLNTLLSPAFSLLPLLVSRHFQQGALQLGWLNTALGIGFLVGGLLLSVWGGFKRRILTSMLGIAGLGVAVLLIGLAPASGLNQALVAMLMLGVALPLVDGPFMAIIQAVVKPGMQGRVITMSMSLSAAASPLGLIVAGPLADLLGIQAWFILAAAMCFVMAAAGLLVPQIAHLEEGRQAPPVVSII